MLFLHSAVGKFITNLIICFRFLSKPGSIYLHHHNHHYYAALLPRRGRILRRTLSVRLSVCLSVCPVIERHVAPPSELQWHWALSLPSVTSRHLANYNDTHVLFATRSGPHIVRPSRPHKFLFYLLKLCHNTQEPVQWYSLWARHTRLIRELTVALSFTCNEHR